MPDEWKEASPVDVIKRFLRANRFRPTVSNSNSLSNFPASLFTFGPIRSPSRGKREDAENDLMAVPFAPPSIEEDNIVKKVGPFLPLSDEKFSTDFNGVSRDFFFSCIELEAILQRSETNFFYRGEESRQTWRIFFFLDDDLKLLNFSLELD